MVKACQPILHDKKREATSSFRGYVYQVFQSILAWMLLTPEDIMYLEASEDFDIHEVDKVTATQIKDTKGSGAITLRSPDVVEAINNCWRHKQNNPANNVRLRYLTTAFTAQEKGSKFGTIGKGIDYWSLAARDETLPVSELKYFLLGLSLDSSLKTYLAECTDSEFRKHIITSICWDTGAKPKDELIRKIETNLIIYGDRKGIDSISSKKALDYLTRKIIDLLSSQKNHRQLTYEDFCVDFDLATTVVMSKADETELRSKANQRNEYIKLLRDTKLKLLIAIIIAIASSFSCLVIIILIGVNKILNIFNRIQSLRGNNQISLLIAEGARLSQIIIMGVFTSVGYFILWTFAEKYKKWKYGAGGSGVLPSGLAACVLSLALTIPLSVVPICLINIFTDNKILLQDHLLGSLLMMLGGIVGHIIMYGGSFKGIEFNGLRCHLMPVVGPVSRTRAISTEVVYAIIYFTCIVFPYQIVVTSDILSAAPFYFMRSMISAAIFVASMAIFVIIRYPKSVDDPVWVERRSVFSACILPCCLCGAIYL